MQSDSYWLEERLLALVQDICKIGVEEGRSSSMQILGQYSELGRIFGCEWEVAYIRQIGPAV